jgi:predicted MFS family arabinose efflux permease
VAIGLLVLGVVQGQPWGWDSPKTIAAFTGAALLLPVFFIRSARHHQPLLDLDLFRIRSFSVASFAQVLFTGSAFGWLVLFPSFFVLVWGWSPLAAGFGLAPAGAISALLSPVAGRLADRIGHRWLVAIGCACGAAGTIWWVVMATDTPDYVRDILPGMVLAGLGTTAGFATLTGALMSRVPPRYYSMAGAARSTLFQLGTAVGIAVAVAIVDSGDSTTVGPYRTVWVIATVCAILAGLLMVALFPRSSIRAEVTSAVPREAAAVH